MRAEQRKTKPAPGAPVGRVGREVYLEAEAGWGDAWRICRHSFSRRSSTWAGMVAAGALDWVVLLICIALLLTGFISVLKLGMRRKVPQC